MDAKQRVLISSPYSEDIPTEISVRNERTGQLENRSIMVTRRYNRFCAEPSPDALSALAASLGVDLSVAGKGDLGVKQAFSEGAASIGIRTTAVQALRDITYRDCESYINGGVTKLGLETLQRRFQSTLVAVLAIEQLTGAFRAPTVALTGQTAATDAESLSNIIDQVNKARTALDAAKMAQATADGKAASTAAVQQAQDSKVVVAKADAEKARAATLQTDTDKATVAAYDKLVVQAATAKTDAVAAKDDAKKAALAVQDKQSDFDAQSAIRTAAAQAAGTSSINAQFAQTAMSAPMDKDAVIAVAGAVERIVDSALNLGFGREVCTTVFGHIVEKGDTLNPAADGSLGKMCMDYLKKDIDHAAAMISLTEAEVGLINKFTEKLTTLPADSKAFTDMLSFLTEKTKTENPKNRLGSAPFDAPVKIPPTVLRQLGKVDSH